MAKTPSLPDELIRMFKGLTLEEKAKVLDELAQQDHAAKEQRLVELLEEAGRLWTELGKKGTAPGRNYLLKKD